MSDGTWLQAANDIKLAVAVCRGVSSLADIVEELGNLDEARDSAQQHLDKLNAEMKAKEELFTKLIAERTSQMEHARKEATETLETAEAQANQMEHDARAQVRKLLEDAHAEAKQLLDEAQATVHGHMATVAEHRKDVEALKVEHKNALGDLERAKVEHGRLTKLIQELKAKF